MSHDQMKTLMVQEIDVLLLHQMEEIKGGSRSQIEDVKICGSCQNTCKQCQNGGK